MNLELENKVVLVADSCAQSASAMISTLKREGARVAACLMPGQEAPAGADESFVCDMAEPEQAERLRESLAARFGRLDALVFRQEDVRHTSVLTQGAEEFTQRLRAARAAFVCCKVFGAYMGSLGSGAIVFVTTLHDEKPNGSDFTHSVAQGMLENLVMEAALEYGAMGVRVNQIAAGALRGMPEAFQSELTTFYEGAQFKTPLCRLGAEEDVADMAAFLLSGRAGFINGARVRVDGGMVLQYVDPKANHRALAHRKEAH